MRYRNIYLAILALMLPMSLHAQQGEPLRTSVQRILDTIPGKAGISVQGISFADTFTVNGSSRFAMQSVYKFHLALAILDKVDRGELRLDHAYKIPYAELDTATWSPMAELANHKDITLTLEELLRYSVSKSDNNACDILFGLAGGTGYVEQYIRKLGIDSIAIAATEAEMKKGEAVQYTNWSTPIAMTRLLQLFHQGKLLKPSTHKLLMRLMTRSENSEKRLKGRLPGSAVVAHKTGTSGTAPGGRRAALNDAGIITMPDGKVYAISIFIAGYKGDYEREEAVIAAISKLIWDRYRK